MNYVKFYLDRAYTLVLSRLVRLHVRIFTFPVGLISLEELWRS